MPPIMATDLRPEQPASRRRRHYTISDRGCEVSRKCLECPLSRCKHDDPGWYTALREAGPQLAMYAEILRDDLSMTAAAFRFGMQVRSVYRLMDKARKLLGDDLDATEQDLQTMAALPPIRGRTGRPRTNQDDEVYQCQP